VFLNEPTQRAEHAPDLDASLASFDAARGAVPLRCVGTQGAREAVVQEPQDEAAPCTALKSAGARADGCARTWVHLDGSMMGLGGDDSWSPRVHDAYLLHKHKRIARGEEGGSAYVSQVWLSGF
jgi:hypothetical protein